MKIAIPVLENKGDQSPISEHFGHAPYFAFIDMDENKTWKCTVEANPIINHQPGEIPHYLMQKGVHQLIVRGIGGRAIDFFNQANIDVIRGSGGVVKDIMKAYLDNNLYDREYQVKDKHHNCSDH